jgi:hypothetical protein
MEERQHRVGLGTKRRTNRAAFGAALGLGAVALAAVYCHPILKNVTNLGIGDWDYHNLQLEVARKTVVEHFELPLWNPYACGGIPLLAHPLSRVLTPFFLLHLVFGVPLAIRFEIICHLVLAFLGAFLFASASGVRRLGSAVAGGVYAFSSYFAVNLMFGQTEFLSVAYLPLLGWLLIRAGNQREKEWGVALCLALIFGEGGAYVVPISALLIVGLMIAWGDGHLRLMRQLATIGVLAIGLSAVKLFPAIEFISKFPRLINDYSGYSVGSLLYSLLSRDQTVDAWLEPGGKWLEVLKEPLPHIGRHGLVYGMGENGIYVGILGVALAIVGLLAQGRRRWRLLIVFGIFVWLSFGDRIWPSLWSFLHQLPVYDSMRVAQRFRVAWLLGLALFAGIGLDAIVGFVTRIFRHPMYGAVVGVSVVAALFVDLFAVGLGPWRDAFPIAAPAIEPASEFRHARDGLYYDAQGPVAPLNRHSHSSLQGNLPNYYANRGTIECGDSVNVARAAMPFDAPGYRGEVYVADTVGDARITKRTPNALRIHAQLNSDGAVVINQNFYPGWRTSAGKIVDRDGLLAVKLSPGTHEISLWFLPVSFVLGAVVTLGTMGYGILSLYRRRA